MHEGWRRPWWAKILPVVVVVELGHRAMVNLTQGMSIYKKINEDKQNDKQDGDSLPDKGQAHCVDAGRREGGSSCIRRIATAIATAQGMGHHCGNF